MFIRFSPIQACTAQPAKVGLATRACHLVTTIGLGDMGLALRAWFGVRL